MRIFSIFLTLINYPFSYTEFHCVYFTQGERQIVTKSTLLHITYKGGFYQATHTLRLSVINFATTYYERVISWGIWIQTRNFEKSPPYLMFINFS